MNIAGHRQEVTPETKNFDKEKDLEDDTTWHILTPVQEIKKPKVTLFFFFLSVHI